MSKKPLVLIAGVGMTIGATIPVFLGIDDGFGGWSILGGFIGGIAGIWLGVVVSRRYG